MAYRYLGNKSKLSNWIANEIGKILSKPSIIADPMCGTASVSESLAIYGHSIIASDALHFPTLHAKARLLHTSPPKFDNFGGYDTIIRELNSLSPIEGYFFREFGDKGSPLKRATPRLYFTAENASKIDAIREFIRSSFNDSLISELERDLLLHDLILSVNTIANIAGTYGYFRSKISDNAKAPLNLTMSDFSATPGTHSVLQGDASEILRTQEVDAVYLDPPYTKRQYAGNYHVLETIAREDEPEPQGEGGLRPWNNDASDFCYKRKAERAFRNVIEASHTRYFFISYSEDGQLSPETLNALLKDYGSVTVITQDHSRYRSNQNAKSGSILEYLYCLEVN
jgi:adenine-specific DNA methylase